MESFLGKGRKYRKGQRMENDAMANKKKIDELLNNKENNGF